MRKNLKLFRIKNGNLTQHEMAKRCGRTRGMYAHVERGFRDGSDEFWNNLKTGFNLSDKAVKELQKNE